MPSTDGFDATTDRLTASWTCADAWRAHRASHAMPAREEDDRALTVHTDCADRLLMQSLFEYFPVLRHLVNHPRQLRMVDLHGVQRPRPLLPTAPPTALPAFVPPLAAASPTAWPGLRR